MNNREKISFDKPHISLTRTCPEPHRVYPGKYKRNECWYVTLAWFKSYGFMRGGVGGQVDLTGWLPYNKAFSIAIAWGRKLGVVVLKDDIKPIWRPSQIQTMAQKKLVRSLLLGEKIKL